MIDSHPKPAVILLRDALKGMVVCSAQGNRAKVKDFRDHQLASIQAMQKLINAGCALKRIDEIINECSN